MADYKEYVYAVYQEKGFSRAAQKLFVSQPWLSAVVKKEEERIGFPIFDRRSKPISLTPEGEYYIARIEKIMALEKELEDHFQALKQQNHREIRIGSSMFFITYVLPKLREAFQGRHPDVTLSFTEGDSDMLWEKLADGELDLVLEAERGERSDVEFQPWQSEELILAVPTENPINARLKEYCYDFASFCRRREPGGSKPRVPLREFAEQPFLLLKEGNDSHGRSLRMCEEAGFRPQVEMYVAQLMTAYYLVCEGRGLAFVRSSISECVAPTDAVRFYQIDSALAVRDVYLAYAKNRRNALVDSLVQQLLEESTRPL